MKKNKKAFTLIELLAAIIIFGILVLIAIPAVTKYIENARKSGYVATAKGIMDAARNLVNDGSLDLYDTNVTYYIESSCIEADNNLKSPYGTFDPAYVVVTFEGNSYNYYWTSRDNTGMGVKDIIKYDSLDEDDIESNVDVIDIMTTLGIDGREKYSVIKGSNNCEMSELQDTRGNVYGKTGEKIPICIRAKTLHEEICTNTSTSGYCQADGYALNGKITYGNLGEGKTLTVGDAFDCDVNGDGMYSAETERFYYVSDYFDTKTKTFDSSYATLIYYDSVSGEVNHSGAYHYHGPTNAVNYLPTSATWKNVMLKEKERYVYVCNNADCSTLSTATNSGEIENPFDYTNHVERFITLKEIGATNCLALSGKSSYQNSGALKGCNFLLENTKYSDESKTRGYWTENLKQADSNNGEMPYNTYADFRNIGNLVSSNGYGRSVRPVIDVPKAPIALNNNTYNISVTYDANGGLFDNNEVNNVIEYYPHSSTILSGEYKIPTKEGKYFSGWESMYDHKVYYKPYSIINNESVTYKAKWSDEPLAKCIRVTDVNKLHKETCNQTTNYCAATIGNGNTITYGRAKDFGTTLETGDAFDCDVDGDGTYDSNTERFYYVSDYFDTNSKTFNSDYGVLVYYSYYKNGIGPVTTGVAYNSGNKNNQGPVTLVGDLPDTVTWENMSLITENRQILAEYGSIHNATMISNNNLPVFSYTNKAARLLTAQELMKGCNTLEISGSAGDLDNCLFIFEGSNYSNSIYSTYGPWLETAYTGDNYGVLRANSENRSILSTGSKTTNKGVKPAIEVSKDLILN